MSCFFPCLSFAFFPGLYHDYVFFLDLSDDYFSLSLSLHYDIWAISPSYGQPNDDALFLLLFLFITRFYLLTRGLLAYRPSLLGETAGMGRRTEKLFQEVDRDSFVVSYLPQCLGSFYLSTFYHLLYSRIYSIGPSLYISRHLVRSGSSHILYRRSHSSSFITVRQSDFGVLYILLFPSGSGGGLLIMFLVISLGSRAPLFFSAFGVNW